MVEPVVDTLLLLLLLLPKAVAMQERSHQFFRFRRGIMDFLGRHFPSQDVLQLSGVMVMRMFLMLVTVVRVLIVHRMHFKLVEVLLFVFRLKESAFVKDLTGVK